MSTKIDFIVIKTDKDGMFISDNVEGKSYFNSRIHNLLFDDLALVKTPKDNWYKIDHLPNKVTEKTKNQTVNNRYELKAGFPVSDLTPQTIPYDEMDEDSDIKGLYSYTFDTIEGAWEEIEFNIEILSEEDRFYVEKPKYLGTPSLITQLTTNPALYPQRDCIISGKEFYKIIRNYIKTFIDGKYAKITSDYDFCLTVEKVIHLNEPVPYTVGGGTKRKPTTITRYRDTRAVVVLKTSPEGYSGYPTQKGISGENQEDLDNKVTKYLEDLITEINSPMKDCVCCKGRGVILEDNEK